MSIRLELENGQIICGESFGADFSSAGEIVFNTAMTGYPESLSDPSYYGQILVLTYPLIGNYGVPEAVFQDGLHEKFESSGVKIKGLVVANYSENYHHWNARKSLGEWLRENNIPGISGVDTRALTRFIREHGVMKGKIISGEQEIPFYDPDAENLASYVSIKEKVIYGSGSKRILLVDLGVKNNIIRRLLKRDTTIIRVPWDYPFLEEDYHGILLSNGPGNPVHCKATINHLKLAIQDKKPIFGICLGNQLMALACGGDTFKLKYGHRSHNQPVLKVGTNKCYITSQNHGYAAVNESLGNDWEPLFINLNDGTNEGFRHKSKPFFSTQFHPEASSGPTDTDFLFDEFIKMIEDHKKNVG